MQLERVSLGNAVPEDPFEKNVEKGFYRLIDLLREMLNGGLKFSDNFNAQMVSTTTSAVPDAEAAVAHTLKRVPSGYLVYSRDKAAVVYDGTTAWTATNIYIRSNVASVTAKLIVF